MVAVVHAYSGMEKSGAERNIVELHQPCRHAIQFGRFLRLLKKW
jgi:hypothetical protein